MPRLNVVDPASEPVKQIFDGPLKGKHFNIFKGMANSPAALNFYLAASGALAKASLSAKEQEIVHLAVSQENNCDYCLAAHTAIGKGAGLSDDQTLEARKGGDLGDSKLNALATFAKSVHEKRGFVSDDDIAAFRDAGYNDGAIAEVAALYGLATYTNFFNHFNETEIDFPVPASV